MRGNLDEIKPDGLRCTQCIHRGDNAVIVTFVIDQPDFADIDEFVGARSFADGRRIDMRTGYEFILYIQLAGRRCLSSTAKAEAA